MSGCRLFFRNYRRALMVAGNMSRLHSFSTTATKTSPSSSKPEFVRCMLAGVAGAASYAAYASNRSDDASNSFKLSRQERDKELETEREKKELRHKKMLEKGMWMSLNYLRDSIYSKMIALNKVEKVEEERKARERERERIRHQLEADKAKRRLGQQVLPHASGSAQSNKSNLAIPAAPRKSSSTTKRPAPRAELLSDSLRTLRRSCKGDVSKTKMAFETLQIYVRNVINSPDQDKYRKIRLTNPTFQDRVGSLRGGIRFLELCGFEKMTDQFLYLPRDKVDMAVLNAAMRSLQYALTNSFFGLLSIELPKSS